MSESSRRQVKRSLSGIPDSVVQAMHAQDRERLFSGEITQHTKIRFMCEHCGEWFEMTTIKYKGGQRCPCQRYRKIARTRKINSSKNFKYMDAVHVEDREKMLSGELGISDKIRFICEKCGEYFLMTGLKYNSGQRCSCDRVERIKKGKRRKDYDFEDMHPEDLIRVKNGEVNSLSNVRFICEIHGVYEQSISNHKNHGCMKCGIEKRSRDQRRRDYDFLHEVREDYQGKVVNGDIANNVKIPFICETHGEYWQTLAKHEMLKHGCPECSFLAAADLRRTKSFIGEDFLREDEYERLKTVGIAQKDTAIFVCDKHGEYTQTVGYKHYNKSGCPLCNMGLTPFSFLRFLETLGVEIIVNDRQQIAPKEIDFYLPKHRVGFEFNDFATHQTLSDNQKTQKESYGGKHELYHYDKYKAAEEKGITLVHVWDVDWQDEVKRKAIEKGIISLLNGTPPQTKREKNTMFLYDIARKATKESCLEGYKANKKKIADGKMGRFYTCGIYWGD